jgi:hypothetical protein
MRILNNCEAENQNLPDARTKSVDDASASPRNPILTTIVFHGIAWCFTDRINFAATGRC